MHYHYEFCNFFFFLGDLLRINDELNNQFLRYERYDKKRTAILSSLEQPSKPKPVPAEVIKLVFLIF